MLFVTLHGFLIIFPYFESLKCLSWRHMMRERWRERNCRSDAGIIAVMTFLTALRLNPKGISRSTVANTDFCACKLYGGQPHVVWVRETVWTVSIRSCVYFFFAYVLLPFLYPACFLLSVMSNWELCFSPTVCSWGGWKVSSEAPSLWLR